MLRIDSIVRLISLTLDDWRRRRPELIGAAIAFYLLFSIGPLLFIIVNFTGLVFGKSAAESQLIHEIETFVGHDPAEVIRSVVLRSDTYPANRLTAILSVPLLIFGAAMVFYQLKNALNYIWRVPSRKNVGLLAFLGHYLSSFFMVMFMGLILVLLVMKSLALSMLRRFLSTVVPFPSYLIPSLDFIVTVVILTFLFAMIYKILTEAKIRWSDEWIGAAVTSILFTASQFVLGLYFSTVRIATAYGAIGSFTILLVWVYWSSLVFLLGAMFTKVYAQEYGSLRKASEPPKLF